MNMRWPKRNLFNQVIGISSVMVLVVGLLITFLAWRYTRDNIATTTQNQFKAEVNEIEYALTRRIKTYSNILYALQGLFAASVSVDRQEWSPFVKTARIADYPDISYVGYIEVVRNDNKAEFTEKFRNDISTYAGGYPNLFIYPEGDRNEYAVVKYIDPENTESINVLGFDVYSSPERKAAFDSARDTNQPVATQLISLATDNSSGFLIAAPVYENGASINTPEERNIAIRGFVVIAFKTTDLFADAFPAGSHPAVSFALYDGNQVLYTNGDEQIRNSIHAHPYAATKTLTIGTRTWDLEVVSESRFANSFSKGTLPLVVGFGGIVISVLFFSIIYSFGQRTNQLIQLQSTALEATANGVMITDTSGIILWVNAAFTHLTGYEAAEIIGRPARMLKSSMHGREFYLKLWNTITAGKTWTGELTNKRKDGSLYQEEQMITPVKDQRGNITHFVAIKQDVSLRKETQEKILSTNKELEDSKKAMANVLDDLNTEKEKLEQEYVKDEAIFSAIGEGLIVTDQTGKILMVNHAFERLLGWKKSEVIGKDMAEIIPKYDENGTLILKENRSLTKILAGSDIKENTSTLAVTHYYVRHDGTRLPIMGIVTPILLNNQIVGAVQVFHDVTSELEVNRMKDEFLNIAAHDLRTPSAAVRGFISRVLDGDAGMISEKARDMLQSAYDGNLRLIKLIDDYLIVSRFERGKIKIDPKIGKIEEAVPKAIALIAGFAKEKNLYLKYDPVTLPNVLIDEERIIELLINLIGNAIKFTSNGGITVTHEVTPDTVITHVTDTGIGISATAQKQLFKKYFKVSSQEIAQSGLGLGLYISKLIMDGHGGKIWANSEEGKGATFSFSLSVTK